MAGDWIKMRNNLWDDPRVSQICDATGSMEAAVVGGLYWLWSAADEHTESGHMPGLSVTGIDRKTGLKGFGAALVLVGWIDDTEGGITINRFDEHNGSSAKRRGADAQRKANGRNVSARDADNAATESGQFAPDCGAREEKNREEKNKEEKNREEQRRELPESTAEATLRATRLPADWIAPPDYIEHCKAARPDLDPAWLQEKFRDYWLAKPGKDGLKLDWFATWRNFCKTERTQAKARDAPRQEKFDPLSYVNRNRIKPNERTTFDERGNPV